MARSSKNFHIYCTRTIDLIVQWIPIIIVALVAGFLINLLPLSGKIKQPVLQIELKEVEHFSTEE